MTKIFIWVKIKSWAYGFWKKISDNSNAIQALATIGILIAGLVGLRFVVCELDQLQRQNSYLERTMRQSFRPLGVCSYSTDLKSREIKIGYLDSSNPNKFSFRCELFLYNRGKGILIDLGSFSYLSKKEVDFRKLFLDGKVDSVNFDARYSYTRRSPVHPDDYIEIKLEWRDVDSEDKYFLYTILLYEDQDGNLYDTERLDVFKFDYKFSPADSAKSPHLQEGSRRETYHAYSPEEKQALIEEIEKRDHPLANVIRLGH